MRTYLTLHEHDCESLGRYLEVVWDAAHAVLVLKKEGHKFSRQHIHELVSGKRWSNRIIVVKHEIDDCEAITSSLLNDLKLRGQKEAKALLRQRKQKRK